MSIMWNLLKLNQFVDVSKMTVTVEAFVTCIVVACTKYFKHPVRISLPIASLIVYRASNIKLVVAMAHMVEYSTTTSEI